MITVNADDFGISQNVNHAIAAGFAHGLVSSATVMANMPAFTDACEIARRDGLTQRIGIHINITEGSPLTTDIQRFPKFCASNGEFHFRRNTHWLLSTPERCALGREVRAQMQTCRDQGLTITHADSHHHVHTEPSVFSVIRPLLREFEIGAVRPTENLVPKAFPVALYKAYFNRWLRRSGFGSPDFLCEIGTFDVQRYRALSQPVWWEVMVHPGYGENGELLDLGGGLPLLPRLESLLQGESPAPYSPHEISRLIEASKGQNRWNR